jgi:hypothetical protein
MATTNGVLSQHRWQWPSPPMNDTDNSTRLRLLTLMKLLSSSMEPMIYSEYINGSTRWCRCLTQRPAPSAVAVLNLIRSYPTTTTNNDHNHSSPESGDDSGARDREFRTKLHHAITFTTSSDISPIIIMNDDIHRLDHSDPNDETTVPVVGDEDEEVTTSSCIIAPPIGGRTPLIRWRSRVGPYKCQQLRDVIQCLLPLWDHHYDSPLSPQEILDLPVTMLADTKRSTPISPSPLSSPIAIGEAWLQRRVVQLTQLPGGVWVMLLADQYYLHPRGDNEDYPHVIAWTPIARPLTNDDQTKCWRGGQILAVLGFPEKFDESFYDTPILALIPGQSGDPTCCIHVNCVMLNRCSFY